MRRFISFLRENSFAALLVRRDDGSALLELAVAIPVLLLIVVGVVDYARLYTTGITVANATIAAAQYGAAGPPWNSTDSMRNAAQRDAGTVLLDSVTTARFCRCPEGIAGVTAGIVDCATGSCGSYGEPQQFDSVRVRKDVALLFNYPGLRSSIAVIRAVTVRSQ